MAGVKIFSLVLFLALLARGSLQCYPGKLIVSQASTGAKLRGKPEWKVTVANVCICTQTDVQLTCGGFHTVEKVDPSILAVSSGDACTFNNGNPIYGNTNVTFAYAWDHQFPFAVAFSTEVCS